MNTRTTTQTPALPSRSSGSETSPTPSHDIRRQSRHKKAISDPFLSIPDDAIKLPEPSTAQQRSDENANSNGAAHSSSLLVDLVLTPLNMITLMVSLSLADRQQRQWRLSQRPDLATDTIWARLTSWMWRWDSDPYPKGRAGGDGSSDAAVRDRDEGTYQGWYTSKKHRAMAKMELDDALEMRGRVLLALVVWMGLGLLAISYAMWRACHYGWSSI